MIWMLSAAHRASLRQIVENSGSSAMQYQLFIGFENSIAGLKITQGAVDWNFLIRSFLAAGIVVTPARCCPASAAAPERARANPAGHGQATMTRRIGDAAGRGRRNFGARSQKIVASRLCDLGASASAVRQADSLRGAAHPVINSRTSEHHIFSRPLLSVRMFGSWGRKRANASSNCAAL